MSAPRRTYRWLAALLPLLWLASLSAPARAECQCLWGGPFTKVQSGTDLVVAGVVVLARGNSIDLRVERVLRGAIVTEQARVWLELDDGGSLCRAKPGAFAAGSQWVMALHRIERVPAGGFNPHTPNLSFGRAGDYSLSRCGGYWLARAGDMVSGALTGGPRWEMRPQMSPVPLDLLAGYLDGSIGEDKLRQAGALDPALQRLMVDTRAFLRGQR